MEFLIYRFVELLEILWGRIVWKFLEKYRIFRIGFLIIVLLGICMVIGDGVLIFFILGVVISFFYIYRVDLLFCLN